MVGTQLTGYNDPDGYGHIDGPGDKALLQGSSWSICCDRDGSVYISESGWGESGYFKGVRKVSFSSKLSINAKEPAFSPNEDGRLDANGIQVVADGKWTLDVKDHPGTLGGMPTETTGNKEFNWDGTVAGALLSDGKYILEVTDGSALAKIEVIVDNTPPTIDLTIDGMEDPEIVDNQLIRFDAQLSDDLSGYEGRTSVLNFGFSVRQDGLVPTVAPGTVKFDAATHRVTYKVPPLDESILYAGDQSVYLQVQDRAGNRSETRKAFAIGGHTLWSDSNFGAYRTTMGSIKSNYAIAGVEQLYENPNLAQYRNAAYRITMLDPDVVYSRQIPKGLINLCEEESGLRIFPKPGVLFGYTGLFLVSNAISGDTVTYVYFDERAATIGALIKKGQCFKLDIGKIGNDAIGTVEVDDYTWRHIDNVGKHKEVGPTMLATSLVKLKRYYENPGEIELWKNPAPAGKKVNIEGKKVNIKDDRLLLIKYKGNLFQIVIHNKAINNQYVRTAYGAGRHPGDTVWPTLKRQWLSIILKIASFDSKDSPLWFLSNPASQVQYPNWIVGEIIDDNFKPYVINKIARRAEARVDREISNR